MHPSTHRRPARRRVAVPGLVLAAVLAATGACGVTPPDAPGGRPATSAPAEPAPTAPAPESAGLPQIPVRSADLGAAAVPETAAPVSLSVPALEIAVPVDPVGVRADGQMEVPPLAERAGWYRFGPAPGAGQGTAVVAAHVDSVASAGLGPFARLPDAAVGDLVHVDLSDGSTLSFVVTDVRRTAKAVVTWSEVFVRDGAPRLVLVTCGGRFQRDAGSYTDNVIVTAEPAGGP